MPDPTLTLTWPQAAVAIFVILATTIVPSVLTFLSARNARMSSERVEKSMTSNNGGGSMKDFMDRTDASISTLSNDVCGLTQRVTNLSGQIERHIVDADRRDGERDGRLSMLERSRPKSRRRWRRR